MTKTARIALLQLPAFPVERAEESLAHTLRRIDEVAQRERPDVVVLPEATYPAYFLGRADLAGCDVLSPVDAAERFADAARRNRIYLAAGLALDAPGGGYANGALLFGRDGSIVGRYDKAFLWHFDRRWFSPGSAYPVFDTDVGRVGMLVCADGRLPEIARSLALNGAQVILDLTAWVSGGRRIEDLSTTQVEHLVPVRAMENGVWFACADKFGVEAESIVYAGRTCFIDPEGRVVAALGPDEDATLVHDVRLAEPNPPIVRRPELYETLTQPTESLPVVRMASEPVALAEAERRVAVVQMAMPPTGGEFVAAAVRHVERQALMDSDLVLFPATPSRYRHAYIHDDVLAGMSELAERTGVCLAFTVWRPDGDGWRTMYLIGPKGVLGAHRQTHRPRGEKFAAMPLGDEPAPVLATPVGRVGLMLAAEGFVPEVARSLMLRGAELLLWAADAPMLPMLPFVRTRAEENRLYVVAAAAPTAAGATAIGDPNGSLVAIALEGRELAVNGEVNPALAHLKRRVPGTDVVHDRQPSSYATIARMEASARPSP